MRVLALAGALLLSGCRQTGAAPASALLAHLNASYSAPSTSSLAPVVAQAAGFYQQRGLDVAMQFSSPASLTAALISGSLDTGTGSPGSVASAVVQGAELAIIGAQYEGSTFSIVARPEVKSLQDLKGKKIGATQRGATTDFLIHRVAQQEGLAAADVNIVYIPDQASQIGALSSGALDAAVFSEPLTAMALAQPGNHLVYSPQSQGATDFVSMSVFVVKRSFIPAHRDVLERFLLANMDAIHLMKSDPDQAVKYIGPILKIDDPKVVKSSLEATNPVLRDDLSLTMPGLQSVLDATATSDPAVAKLKPQDLVDLSLLDDLKKKG